MKKKISVFALLLSLLIAVLVPVQAKAANSEVEIYNNQYSNVGEFLHDLGYTDFVYKEDCSYIVYVEDYLVVFEIDDIDEFDPYVFIGLDSSGFENLFVYAKTDCSGSAYWCYKPDEALLKENYSVNYMGLSTGQGNFLGVKRKYVYKQSSSEIIVLWSDFDVYLAEHSSDVYRDTSNLLVAKTVLNESYTFQNWCADASLNCQASSNESASVIPYSYNDYWHIVRKTSSGNWLLTTIGSTLGQSKMNLRLSDSGDLIIYEFSGDDSFVISVRQYVYDTDGWKVHTYDTYDYDDFSSGILTLPAGSGIDDTRVLAYTSTDIYSSDGLSVYAAASTEYSEPSVPDVTPEPTPDSGSSGSGDSDDTSSDSSGSSGGGRPGSGTRPSVGGEASGGGGLDFIINLFTLIWTKICSVPMQVDGYSISLQQLFVYGALVSIVGGFIMKFIFRR